MWGDGRLVLLMAGQREERPWLVTGSDLERRHVAWPVLRYDAHVEVPSELPGALLLRAVLSLLSAQCTELAIADLLSLDRLLIQRVLQDAEDHGLTRDGALSSEGSNFIRGSWTPFEERRRVVVIQDAVTGVLLGVSDADLVTEPEIHEGSRFSLGTLGRRHPLAYLSSLPTKENWSWEARALRLLTPHQVAGPVLAGKVRGRVVRLTSGQSRWLLLPAEGRRGDAAVLLDPFASVPIEFQDPKRYVETLGSSSAVANFLPEISEATQEHRTLVLPEAFRARCSREVGTLLKSRRAVEASGALEPMRLAAAELGLAMLTASAELTGATGPPDLAWFFDQQRDVRSAAAEALCASFGLPCPPGLPTALDIVGKGGPAGLDAHLMMMLLDRNLQPWRQRIQSVLPALWAQTAQLKLVGVERTVAEEFERLRGALDQVGTLLSQVLPELEAAEVTHG